MAGLLCARVWKKWVLDGHSRAAGLRPLCKGTLLPGNLPMRRSRWSTSYSPSNRTREPRDLSSGVLAISGVFLLEFSLRFYDSPSRLGYLKGHWLDLVSCIPVVGSLRVLRLLRLAAFFRLGATARVFGLAVSASERVPGGTGLLLVGPNYI